MASALAGREFEGIDHVAFSDLFLEDVRAYREDRLAQADKHCVFPLWDRDTAQLAQDIIAQGFRAIVVCLDPRVMDPSFAGRAFDLAFLADLPNDVDPCGENGEFHTFVWDAPMYQQLIPCTTGDVVTRLLRRGFAITPWWVKDRPELPQASGQEPPRHPERASANPGT
jgi:diphthamide synthase (EF-2-diphthine--ammonia ligase)